MGTPSVNLDFFAAEADLRAVFDFCFGETDVRVFESYSLPDAELREFKSTSELARAFPLGTDECGNGYAVGLQLWSPSVMKTLDIQRFALDPAKCDGHTFRHRIDGGGLMQLHLGGICANVVTSSHFGHRSQSHAEAWNAADGVNWQELKTLSNRIQYHVRKRLAKAQVRSCPVLAQALDLAQRGYVLEDDVQIPWEYELEPKSEPG